MDLLAFTSKGIYCKQADVYIDPWKPVNKALITHGHSDHARYGHKSYLCTDGAKPVIKYRLGKINIQSMPFGKEVTVNGVKFSFHPAGHIIGSAQIKVSYKGEIWVASGDYKLADDGLCTPFEPIKCNTFITESTFGLPVYHWQDQAIIFDQINQWWRRNKQAGKTSILSAYSLGKAQRIISQLDTSIGPIFTHGAIENTNEIIRKQGFDLPPTTRITTSTKHRLFPGSMVIAPPSVLNGPWVSRFGDYAIGSASGWMMLRGPRRRRAVDRGFVLSDHADWNGLLTAVRETGASRVIVTHGYTEIFSRWLKEEGLDTQSVKTHYEGALAELTDLPPEDKKEDSKLK